VIKCSRAGCSQAATFKLNWRNLKVHAADRVKVWASCDEHIEYLRSYLDSRGFLLGVEPI
jgi:hypothetical protein